jgi:2,4-dienoyl-CoA reductase-like NADH-dependent reductase (Old Yellow Enzyme family)
MSKYPFIRSYEHLTEELIRLGLELPLSDDISVLGKRLYFEYESDGRRLGSELENRFVVQPMEGFDAGEFGEPLERSFRRYEQFAAGGAGLVWFEATAILPEARSNSRQFWLNKKSFNAFASLLERTKSIAKKECGHNIVTIIQLTHSGRYSKPERGIRSPIIAQHNEVLDAAQGIPPDYPLVSDDELFRIQDAFIDTAKLAARCGFDGVDVKSCHGYLLNELLGARQREGIYGGTLENRSRFLQETIRRIRNEVSSIFVTSRLSVYDAVKFPWGFGIDQNDYRQSDLLESRILADMLRETGVPLLNITIGNPYFNPHYNRPYATPVRGTTGSDENPLIGVARFVEIVKNMQKAFPNFPMVGAGTAWLRELMPKVAAGIIANGWATLFGQGRNSFAYPNAPKDILNYGKIDPKKACITCSRCTELMREESPTGCEIKNKL